MPVQRERKHLKNKQKFQHKITWLENLQEELELEERKHYVNSGKLKNTTRKKKIYIEDSEESWSSDKKVKYVKEKKRKKKSEEKRVVAKAAREKRTMKWNNTNNQ